MNLYSRENVKMAKEILKEIVEEKRLSPIQITALRIIEKHIEVLEKNEPAND